METQPTVEPLTLWLWDEYDDAPFLMQQRHQCVKGMESAMQACLDESVGKLKEAQQVLQSVQSSSTAQQVQLTQQLTVQTERLATAQQVTLLPSNQDDKHNQIHLNGLALLPS